MDKVYRVGVMWDNGRSGEVIVEPNPYGDPYTVKLTIPVEQMAPPEFGANAWVILPRDMFSADVNGMTS